MENKTVKDFCREGTAYSTRIDTDKFFQLPQGSFNYTRYLDKSIKFIEDFQLKDAGTWKLFVDQFRGTYPDDQNQGWRCEYWGKMMRGAAFVYQYTQDSDLYKILEDTVYDLISTQDELGRIATYSTDVEFHGWDLWGRKYVLLGLQYFIEICKSEKLEKKIVNVMCRHADYIMDKIGLEEDGKILITKATNNWLGLNSASILEPYVRLYNITGEKKYLDFSKYIVDTGATTSFNLFDLAYDGKLYPFQYPVDKAYEMMSCFEGLLEYYRVTHIEKHKIALIKFAKLVMDSDITIIGCSGCTHELFDFSRSRQTTTEWTGIMQETCVTVTWMKFCFQILCLSGDAYLADAIETSIYNALLGSINTEKIIEDNGLPFDSYAPLLMNMRGRIIGGGQFIKENYKYGCCAAIAAAGMGLIPMSSVMTSCDGIVFNLYIPGKIKAYAPSGNPVELTVDTDYPALGKINIELNAKSENFKLYIRIPKWSLKTSLTVDGERIKTSEGEYAVIDKTWSNNKICLELDMRARVIKPFPIYPDKNAEYHVALQRGPVVMARDRRLGENIEEPVNILCDKDGYVELTPQKTAKFDTTLEFSTPTVDGGSFTVIDFASAGKTWSEDSMMTVWMPTRNYWETDFSKPIVMYPSGLKNIASVSNETLMLNFGIDKSGDLSAYRFNFENTNNGWKISFNGRYLAVCGDKIVINEKDDSAQQLWEVRHYAQNRYRIYSKIAGKYITEIYSTNQIILSPYSKHDEQIWNFVNK